MFNFICEVQVTSPMTLAGISIGIISHAFQIVRLMIACYNLPTPPLGQDMTQGQFLSGV